MKNKGYRTDDETRMFEYQFSEHGINAALNVIVGTCIGFFLIRTIIGAAIIFRSAGAAAALPPIIVALVLAGVIMILRGRSSVSFDAIRRRRLQQKIITSAEGIRYQDLHRDTFIAWPEIRAWTIVNLSNERQIVRIYRSLTDAPDIEFTPAIYNRRTLLGIVETKAGEAFQAGGTIGTTTGV